MNGFYSNLFFLLLNNSLYIGLVVWFIYYHLMPAIRASKTVHNETRLTLSQEITQQQTLLHEKQEQYQAQTREISRLTAIIEKWAGVLSQRAVTTEQETRELSFRYKNRCAENARARALQNAHKIVTTQVLKNVRAFLIQEYAQQAKQREYRETIFHKITSKDAHERA